MYSLSQWCRRNIDHVASVAPLSSNGFTCNVNSWCCAPAYSFSSFLRSMRYPLILSSIHICARLFSMQIVNTIAANPGRFNSTLPERSNASYCQWIMNTNVCGGAIELQIFAEHFLTESHVQAMYIFAVRISTGCIRSRIPERRRIWRRYELLAPIIYPVHENSLFKRTTFRAL